MNSVNNTLLPAPDSVDCSELFLFWSVVILYWLWRLSMRSALSPPPWAHNQIKYRPDDTLLYKAMESDTTSDTTVSTARNIEYQVFNSIKYGILSEYRPLEPSDLLECPEPGFFSGCLLVRSKFRCCLHPCPLVTWIGVSGYQLSRRAMLVVSRTVSLIKAV